MNRSRRQACLTLAGGLIAASGSAQDAAAINKSLGETKPQLVPTTRPGAQWFAGAGLGLFIHWGISSVDGNLDISWGMMHGMGNSTKITPEEYFRLAERFRPGQWDPDKMLAAAKAAGFRYAVLTTKHHEGFALWPSAHGEFNTRKYCGGRDLVAPYVQACRKHGLKVGFYYSPGDWYYARDYMSFNYRSAHCWQNTGLACRPGVPDYNTRFEPVTLPQRSPEFERSFGEYKRGQIQELLTRYGKVDLLWFDMASPDVITPDELRQLQPDLVINNRMGGNTGDFLTPEGSFPKQRPGGWWELCSIWNAPHWGYVTRNEDRYLPAGAVLSRLAQSRAWGGNLLINVGPRPDGAMPKPYWQGMEQVAAWMKHSRESVFGVTAGGWPEEADVPVTVRGRRCYLHALPEVKSGELTVRLDRKPSSAKLLRTGQKLPFQYAGGRVTVNLARDLRTDMVDVVEVKT